jgi:hypothetical protein
MSDADDRLQRLAEHANDLIDLLAIPKIVAMLASERERRRVHSAEDERRRVQDERARLEWEARLAAIRAEAPIRISAPRGHVLGLDPTGRCGPPFMIVRGAEWSEQARDPHVAVLLRRGDLEARPASDLEIVAFARSGTWNK